MGSEYWMPFANSATPIKAAKQEKSFVISDIRRERVVSRSKRQQSKQEAMQTHWVRHPNPHHLVWGIQFGEHDLPPLENVQPFFAGQPAVSNHQSATPLRDVAQ